jgi:predicted chitinase
VRTLRPLQSLLSDTLLPQLGVSPERADRFLPALRVWLPLYGIDRPLRLAHFLAQVLHESGRMEHLVENLHYSAERLLRVFPSHFSTLERAARYAGDPQKLGNFVYANRLGNGPEESGDGYRYRGRGLIQITGRTHYQQFSRFVNADLLTEPERVAGEFAVASAVYFWNARKLNAEADRDDLSAVTRRVNGGLNGLPERAQHLQRAKDLLGIGEHGPLLQPTHRVRASGT